MKPPESAIWSNHAIQVHGLYKGHASIIDADPLGLVWDIFILYFNGNIHIGKYGVLVAWSGETCDK